MSSYDPNAHRSCRTCGTIKSDWRKSDLWLDNSYWRPFIDDLPREVLLDMAIAELHAIHHDTVDHGAEAIVLSGITVLVNYLNNQDMIPRAEANHALNDQFSRMQAQITETERIARDEARDAVKADMHELRVRIANVAALLHVAGNRKTMRTDQVNKAVSWMTGEEIPAATIAHQRKIAGLHARGSGPYA